jgi:hypothetical protein
MPQIICRRSIDSFSNWPALRHITTPPHRFPAEFQRQSQSKTISKNKRRVFVTLWLARSLSRPLRDAIEAPFFSQGPGSRDPLLHQPKLRRLEQGQPHTAVHDNALLCLSNIIV